MIRSAILSVLAGATFTMPLRAQAVADISVDPATLALAGPKSSYSLLVTGKTADGGLVDLTRGARYQSSDPKIAGVSSSGIVRGLADGAARIDVAADGHKRTVHVTVRDATRVHTYHFENDIVPLFSRFGCNSSGCHGNADGQ